jgi:hypothetical protein
MRCFEESGRRNEMTDERLSDEDLECIEQSKGEIARRPRLLTIERLINEIRALRKERDEFVGKGFWGRTCAKLQKENIQLKKERDELRERAEKLEHRRDQLIEQNRQRRKIENEIWRDMSPEGKMDVW